MSCAAPVRLWKRPAIASSHVLSMLPSFDFRPLPCLPGTPNPLVALHCCCPLESGPAQFEKNQFDSGWTSLVGPVGARPSSPSEFGLMTQSNPAPGGLGLAQFPP
ncbi:unnamed protein product [Linum trigynum]|uniref:Uncharacterized protein n=1 Tax=Linum trigynum TaxID=586398 RepID=A0AAV2CDH8_9ROSI